MTDFSGHFSNWLRSQSILEQFQIFLDIHGRIYCRYLCKYFHNFLRGFPLVICEIMYCGMAAGTELPPSHKLCRLPPVMLADTGKGNPRVQICEPLCLSLHCHFLLVYFYIINNIPWVTPCGYTHGYINANPQWNPYPCMRVRVLTGTGMGMAKNTHGLPVHITKGLQHCWSNPNINWYRHHYCRIRSNLTKCH